MQRSNTFSLVLIVILALAALGFIFQWQSGSQASVGSVFGSDGRTVAVLGGGKFMKVRPSDLQVGDVILSINGIAVHNWTEAYKVLEALYQPGLDELQIEVRRVNDEGRTEEKTVKLDRDRIASLVLKGAGRRKPDIASYKATPEGLYSAAESGNATAVEQILDAGGKAFIDQPVNGQTPLLIAVAKGNMEVVRVLLDHKANPNAAAVDQTTPLMRAAETGNRDLVAALMVAGADTTLRNSQLQTASDIAVSQGFLDVSDFIENPSPTKFLTADQRSKIAEPLRDMGVLKAAGVRPSDSELSAAIKEYQRRADLPVSGIVTAESYADLVKFARGWTETKNDEELSETTKKTLSRIFSRALTQEWTPVNSTNGYPRCEDETVTFEITPDQKTITWKSYRPGASQGDISSGATPVQQADFIVQWADQRDGYDTIMVRPNPKPVVGPKYQLWEIRDGYMKISLQAKSDTDSEQAANSDDLDTDDADSQGFGLADPALASTGVGRSSYLAMCRS